MRLSVLRPFVVFIFSFVLLGLPGMFSPASAQEKAKDPEPKWGPHIDIEGKPGNKRNLGESDLFLPVYQNDRTLLFMNLRGRFDDHDTREGNAGLGIRRMLEGGWNLGGYGYFDRRRSETGNYYNQTTLGAELLGRNWDIRVNGYIPVGSRIRDLGTTGNTSGDSTASISGTTVQVTTLGTTTMEERALPGFDGEVGWRVPVFGAESPWQFRVYAGGFSFSDGVSRVEGPRARAELSLEEVPWLGRGSRFSLGAEVQDDNVRGGQTFLAARLSIPLGGESKRAPLTMQEKRMTEPVRRDVDIVSQSRVSASTPTVVETATQTADGKPLTVISSNSTAGGALPAAVAAAGNNSTVILSGTFSNSGTTTTLQSGQTLMGTGTLSVMAPSGRSATLTGPGATISSRVNSGSAVTMADNSTLTGMTVVNTTAAALITSVGVTVTNASGATIANCTITGNSGTGVAYGVIVTGTSTNTTLRNNTISAIGNPGPPTALHLNTGALANTYTVTGNTFSASGNAPVYAVNFLVGTVNTAASIGNRITAGSCNSAGGVAGKIGFTDGSTCP